VSRKVIVALILSLLIGMSAVPVRACPEYRRRAQSDDPPRQMTVHIVQMGETLFSIVQQYGLTVDAITHANGIADPRQVYVGQRLVIPGSEGNTGVVGTVPYVAQAGDTLASIARRYYTTWQTLVHVNGLLSPNTIYAGQVLQVPELNQPTSEGATAHPPMSGGLIYVVRADDTLFRTALRHDIPPWTLTTANHVANPALIYPGQELVIPGEGPGLLPDPFASVEVQPMPVAQGTTMIVVVRTTEPVTLEGELFGQDVCFAEEGGVYYGLVGVHVFTEPGLYELELTAVNGQGQSTAITAGVVVEAERFGYERIDLPPGRDSLLEPDVIAADLERLDALSRSFTPERYWATPFRRPCVGVISSYFGTHRAYNSGPYTSYHSGVDYRAPRGTLVYASAAGTVVLAEPLALYGNMIVIDHGWGLLTGYGHLSSFEVEVGQQIAQGDLIGRVGNTGLSTGAHLHWEVRVGGISVNGLQWLEQFSPWSGTEWLAIGG
jgi:murein DD-endopeptidase MepM/ murein hydrolase activator NlpD